LSQSNVIPADRLPTIEEEKRSVHSTLQSSVMPPKIPTSTVRIGPSREQCLIIVDLSEPPMSAPSSQDRVDHDTAQLRDCLSKLFIEGEEKVASSIRVKSVFRIGRRPTEDSATTQPRPVKVVLGCPEEAAAVFRRAHRLRGDKVRILRDLDPEDRVKLRDALKELHERRAAGEQDLYIQDFRVIRRRPRIRWIPLTLVRGEVTQLGVN
jgi:hypothetical protein